MHRNDDRPRHRTYTIPPSDVARVAEIADKIQLTQSMCVRLAIRKFVDEFERTGEVVIPERIRDAKQ